MVMQNAVYGDESFKYQVCFAPRRRKTVSIHVHPNGLVQVDAPDKTDLSAVKAAVLKRAGWVLKHIRQAREQREYVLPRRYVSGESHLYLGRRYQLKVSQSWDSRTEVKLTRGRFLVAAPDASPETVKAALKDWYRQHGLQYIGNRLEAVCDRVPWVSTIPSWRLRVMRKQWGSCSNKGNLSFNTHLVKAPRQCIDYVILHELCHLREHNHSRYFYRLLSDQLPDWKSLKTRLDGMAEILLNE